MDKQKIYGQKIGKLYTGWLLVNNKGDIVIGSDVWIGYEAVIFAGVTICLLRMFLLLPTTPKKPKMTDFHKRKTLQSKELQRFLNPYVILPDSIYFPSPSTSAISRAAAVTIRIPVSLISSSSTSSCRRWVFASCPCRLDRRPKSLLSVSRYFSHPRQ